MGEKTHLGRAIHWSAGPQAHAGEMLAAGLGMAAPLLLAGAMGHQPLGLAAALGSLAIGSGTTPAAPGSEAEMARSAGAQARELAALLAPFAAAAAVAAACSGHGAASDAIVILLAVAAAAIGAYSRPLAVASTRLLLFLVIAANSAGAAPHRGGFLLLALAGALWTCLLLMLLGPWMRAGQPAAAAQTAQATEPVEAAAPGPTTAQRWRRWQRTMASWAGWQYPLRLAFALAAAAALRWLFPGHHFDWIALTVALLIQRQPGLPSLKTTQRVGGTVLGVLLAALLLGHQLPAWVIAVNAGWLAGMRPLLRSRNYLAYSAAMTPLMVLITGAGNASTAGAMSGMLADRVAATVIGAALVILADGVALRLLAKPLSRTSPG
ncbi:FUSC family protein [Cupriavidus sp. 2TAF22]|uniref:FUSC family protein n=1 Tax=unclassified Cupriavidus TaxID=2640874 RepID=UPI003F91AD42